MKEALQKLTFRKPRQIIRPAIWIFFEDFFSLFPAIIIYVAINMLTAAFEDAGAINLKMLWIISSVLLALALAQFAIGYNAYKKMAPSIAEHIAEDRIDYVKKLRRLPLGFFARKEPGELINNFVNDFINIQQAMMGYLSGLFSVVLSCILTSIFMFIYNPIMAAAFYIALPVTVILVLLSIKTLERNSVIVARARDLSATNLNEYLRGMKTLKSYNQTGEGFKKLKDAYHHLMECYIKEEGGSGSLLRLCTSIVQFGIPLLCIAGGYMLLGGRLRAVDFIAIIIIGTKILTPVVTAISNMMILRINYTSAKRLDTTMSEREMPGQERSGDDTVVSFRNVSFAYAEGGELALKNASFTIPRGKLTAIVGPSGSGKSTILRLVARFWDVRDGEIMCGDGALSRLDPESWQENISMVLQDVYLFHETIRENILFGCRDANEEEMTWAAQKAGCHDFIMALPEGYDTIVGEGGSTLSGGERQRISIARAFLKKAPILLLDEPTASLDAKNEVLVQRAVGELVKDTTVVMIAHRLKTIQNADQILVLDKGEIIEQGVHEQLMKRNGLYAKLWVAQQKSMDWNIQPTKGD
ncbi:MAG: ABC transporter ATP-binding protein/permease [Treponema sp.]|jgi:ATP-binding cassette subfamily B protein|nr:ABC transporter ATP-binding protein/permease [Treponema sp.]